MRNNKPGHNALALPLALALGFSTGCTTAPVPVAPTPQAAVQPQPPAYSNAQITAMADLLRLEDRREFAEPRLRALLTDSSAELRRRAVLAVARIGDKRGVPLVLMALADTSPLVHADAAFGLGLLRDTSSEVVSALANQALRGGTPWSLEAGAQAIFALGRINTESARNIVEQALGYASPRIVQEALLAVWKFKRTEAIAGRVALHVRAPDVETRWRAAYALARMGGPLAGAPLLQAARDPAALVRSMAMRGLRASVTDSSHVRDDARAVLLAALSDVDAQVRINAVRALATYREEPLVPRIASLLQDADGNVAITAAQALAEFHFPGAIDPLASVAANPALGFGLRGAALASLGRAAAGEPQRAHMVFARDSLWIARYYAARSLDGLTMKSALSLARTLLEDTDARVVTAALESLVELDTDSLSPMPRLYIQHLAVQDPMVRAAALRGLEKHATADLLPIALDAYERAAKDRDNDAAVAAVDLLAAIVRRGVPAARSFYARFPRPADPVVRRQAQEKLGTGSWGAAWPVETGRDQAFYEQVIRAMVIPALKDGTEPRLRIHTGIGDIVLQLAGSEAPLTAYNMVSLAGKGYFNGGRWHRVVPNFVLQDGDPRGDGNGGPGYSIRDELNRLRYVRGTLGMALSGPDTGGSQFFITFSPQPHLDAGYTVFGRVVSGMDVADRVVQDEPILSIEVAP